jgi:metallophosphoesterase (TIGR00282 family)
MGELRILAVGDVVGRPGRRAVKELVPGLRDRLGVDFIVANAENAAGGSGLTLDTARELLDAGCDCLTTGDHFFEKPEVKDIIANEPRVLRPANWSRHAPGRGWGVFDSRAGPKVGVANLIGRTFMRFMVDNPFDVADDAIEALRKETPLIVVDYHAEATSEKIAIGRYLDGRASAVLGTHTHVPTADAKVLPGSTAYLTDLGMTGPHDSVLGRDYERILVRLRTGVPSRFGVAKKDVRLQGVVVTLDEETGRASAIERVDVALE